MVFEKLWIMFRLVDFHSCLDRYSFALLKYFLCGMNQSLTFPVEITSTVKQVCTQGFHRDVKSSKKSQINASKARMCLTS